MEHYTVAVGEKLDTHNCYIFPYLNQWVTREASITDQWIRELSGQWIKTKQRWFKLQMKTRK